MFKRKPAAPGRPEALENFRRDLDKATDAARFCHVDMRTLADILESRADSLRKTFAVTAPAGAGL
jgi:hypothetical protein